MNDTVLILASLAGAGFVSGLAGFGFGLVAAGALLSLKPPVEATALVLICSVMSQTLSIVRLRTIPPWGPTLVMTAAGILGAPVGVYLLRDLSPDTVKLCVGGFLVVYSVGIGCLRADYKVAIGNGWSDGVVGFLGGLLGGLAGLGGAVPTAWSLVRGWEPRIQRAVYQTFTLVIQAWSLAVLAWVNPLPSALVVDMVLALPVVLVSVLAGLALFARLEGARFRAVVLVLLGLIGLTTVGATLRQG